MSKKIQSENFQFPNNPFLFLILTSLLLFSILIPTSTQRVQASELATFGVLCDTIPGDNEGCGQDLVCKTFYADTKGVCINPLSEDELFCYFRESATNQFFDFTIVKRGGPLFQRLGHDQQTRYTIQFLSSENKIGDLIFANYLNDDLQNLIYGSSLSPLTAVDFWTSRETVYCAK